MTIQKCLSGFGITLRVNLLKAGLKLLKSCVSLLKSRVNLLKSCVSLLKAGLKLLKSCVSLLKAGLKLLKSCVNLLKSCVIRVEAGLKPADQRVSRVDRRARLAWHELRRADRRMGLPRGGFFSCSMRRSAIIASGVSPGSKKVKASMHQQSAELFSESLRLAFTRQGSGRAFLLLHGGAGAGCAGDCADASQLQRWRLFSFLEAWR